MSARENTSIRVEPLHPSIGAAVHGVDFRKPLSSSQFETIHDAWMIHLVLVFPGQAVSDTDHVAFSRHFGDLERHHQKILKSRSIPEIFSVSNVDAEGKLMAPANPTLQQVHQARRWHTDSSFREIPSMGSMLHGGQTCFANMYAGYEAMPADLKAAVENRKARHDFEYLHAFGNLKPLTDAERTAMPPVWQPMVRRHPVTGRASLYISPIYNDEVEGLDKAASTALIDELAEFCSREEFVYSHTWSTDDVVLWDNRCTMHRVTPHDPEERRVMHRTTIVGDGPVVAA